MRFPELAFGLHHCNREALRFVFCTLVLLALSAATVRADTVHVFLAIPPNQSNMFGYGTVWSSLSSDTGLGYPRLEPYVLYNKNISGNLSGLIDSWKTFNTTSAFGPEQALMGNIIAQYPGEKVAYVEFAVGGASIAEFRPDAPNKSFGHNYYWLWQRQFDQAIARIIAAGDTPVIEAAFTMHGESGCATPARAYVYASDWRYIISSVRSYVGEPDLPVIEGRIGSQMLQPAVIQGFVLPTIDYNTCHDYILFRRYMQGGPYPADWLGNPIQPGPLVPCARYFMDTTGVADLNPTSDPNIVCVDMDNLPTRYPGNTLDYHFNSSGCMASGERLFAGLQFLKGWE